MYNQLYKKCSSVFFHVSFPLLFLLPALLNARKWFFACLNYFDYIRFNLPDLVLEPSFQMIFWYMVFSESSQKEALKHRTDQRSSSSVSFNNTVNVMILN